MLQSTLSLLAVATASLSLLPTVAAQNSKVVPCLGGAGNSTLCDVCDESKAIEVTDWTNVTWVKNFTLSESPADNGLGYRVYWKIEQPAEGCRIMLFDSFSTDKGSVDSRLSGRIGLSVNRGGCFLRNVGTGGVGAGACCGDACADIGAEPGANLNQIKSEPPKSKAKKRDQVDAPAPPVIRHRYDRRQGGNKITPNQNTNPFEKPDEPEPPKWNCKSEKISDTYTKAGKQQVDANTYPCIMEGCSYTQDLSVSVASGISSEKSTTITNSKGESQNVNVGFQWLGPTAMYDHGWTKDFSEAIATSTGSSTTDTKSTGVSFSQHLTIGYEYNGWWAPTMNCAMWKVTCDDGKENEIERCDPVLNAKGEPGGTSGIMLTGVA